MFRRHVLLYASSSTWNAMRANGFSVNSKISFMSSGDKSFLTLKIPATSFSRFLWWMFIQSSFLSNYHSWDNGLKSLQSIFIAISRWWWRWIVFWCLVDRWKAFSFISSWDHCLRSSPFRISDTPRAGFEPARGLKLRLTCMKLCSRNNHYTTTLLCNYFIKD